MPDSPIYLLPLKTSVELTDYLVIDDMSATPVVTKKIMVASFLVSLGLLQGFSDSAFVSAGITKTFTFTQSLGTAIDGSDYDLPINCMDALNVTEIIGYTITNRTQNGFQITPVSDAYISFTAILK